jgi:hydrogenase-1 operon protein HyaF
MDEFVIPVRLAGPGSQPADDAAFDCLALPHEVNTFRMPAVPERADETALAAARDLLGAFVAQTTRWSPATEPAGPRLELFGRPAPVVDIVNQMLGEGEVGIRVDGDPCYRIQESVFTGVWRICALDAANTLLADWVEAGALPRVVVDVARAAAAPRIAMPPLPAGAMNSASLVAELAAQMRERRSNAPAHVVNLTLFPLSPEDHVVLDAALPAGPVAIISRGFGNCRVTSTLARDVWRVQYFNSMNTLILNTIEVVAVPEVALAAVEDLVDSRTRLAELVDWMGESLPR